MQSKRLRIWRCDYPEWIKPSERYYIGIRINGVMHRHLLPYRIGKWLWEHDILV